MLRLRRHPTLSNELIEIVVDLVADQIHDSHSPHESKVLNLTPLLACCLVSKAFLHPAHRRVYRSLAVSINESGQLTPPKLPLTIKTCPHLSQLVRSIILKHGDVLSPTGVELADAASTILRSCRGLQDFWLDNFCVDDNYEST